jgi:pyruvate dehydrogenase complex dehydrogenase (E1) component
MGAGGRLKKEAQKGYKSHWLHYAVEMITSEAGPSRALGLIEPLLERCMKAEVRLAETCTCVCYLNREP